MMITRSELLWSQGDSHSGMPYASKKLCHYVGHDDTIVYV